MLLDGLCVCLVILIDGVIRVISMYTGSVGSGKSYHALELGLKTINEKKNGEYRHVVANFPLVEKTANKFAEYLPVDYLRKIEEKNRNEHERWIFNDEISVEYLIALSIERGWQGKESMCLVIIDEAGIIFNSRDWQAAGNVRTGWVKFLALSRKFGYDFIFVTQSDRMIDRQIRGLCEYEIKHRKANNSFMLSWLGMFKISLFMYVYKWYNTKVKANLRMSVFKKSVAARYDTMRVFNFDDLINSIKAMYEGKIIPAPVAVQLALWEKEKLERILEAKEKEEEIANKYGTMEEYMAEKGISLSENG